MTSNSINNTGSAITIGNIGLTGNTISSEDTNGNILFSPDGTGVVAGAASKLIATGTGSGSEVDVAIPTTFKYLIIKLTNYVNSTSAGHLNFRISSDGGSSFVTTGYISNRHYNTWTSSTLANTGGEQTFMPAIYWGSATQAGSAEIYFNHGAASIDNGFFGFSSQGTEFAYVSGCHYLSSLLTNALRFYPENGSITSLTYNIYGLES